MNYRSGSSSSNTNTSSSSSVGCLPSDDTNVTTRTSYMPDGNVASITVVNPTTGDQVIRAAHDAGTFRVLPRSFFRWQAGGGATPCPEMAKTCFQDVLTNSNWSESDSNCRNSSPDYGGPSRDDVHPSRNCGRVSQNRDEPSWDHGNPSRDCHRADSDRGDASQVRRNPSRDDITAKGI